MNTSIFVGFLAMISAASVGAQEKIVLHFYERPPYMVKNADGSATGLSADPARAAFERAGIAFEWALTPAKRQLKKIQSNDGFDCGVGWYKNAEREAVGKFTHPIYQDKPTVVIARSDFKPGRNTLMEMLADPKVTVVVKDGLTYGRYVFAQIGKAKAQVRKVTDEQPSIARMISAGHADFMFSPQEEADLLIASSKAASTPLTSMPLKVFHFPDIEQGDTRHILCSKKVSDATIAQLDRVLDVATGERGKKSVSGKAK